jgi:hypothetical protein
MLVAEAHGKILAEAQNNEDYLTSAVFGNLRYVAPSHFWHRFLERTKSSTADESPLTKAMGHPVSNYTRLDVAFWPFSPQYGEPDLVLRFSGSDHPALIVIVEVKLWSGKSGLEEWDQLARYVRLLDDLKSIGLHVSNADYRFLVYLTPRDSLAEIDESLATLSDEGHFRQRVYRVQWQDLLEVAGEVSCTCGGTAAIILADIAKCLKQRNLEYFDGFRSAPLLNIGTEDGRFYQASDSLTESFKGFSCVESLETFAIQHGEWIE